MRLYAANDCRNLLARPIPVKKEVHCKGLSFAAQETLQLPSNCLPLRGGIEGEAVKVPEANG